MTDREPTPAEEERVRRLLAAARHDGPMPAEVVARLDSVLRGLADERAKTLETATERPTETTAARPAVAHRAPVVDLAARRRRRRATSFLVAAAAVTVIGVGVPQILGDLTLSGENDSASAGGDAGNDVPEASSDLDGRDGNDENRDALKGARLSVDSFDQDVAELSAAVRSGTKDPQESPTPTDAETVQGAGPGSYAACLPGVRQDAWGEGDLLRVRYDGRRGVLVFRAPEGDTQRVDLFLCGETEPTRSTVVPVP